MHLRPERCPLRCLPFYTDSGWVCPCCEQVDRKLTPEALAKALGWPVPRVRQLALWHLAHKSRCSVVEGAISKAVEAAIKALGDPAWSVRNSAAVLMKEIPAPEALPALVRALQDEDEWVAANAAEALAKQQPSLVRLPLLRILGDGAPRVRAGAAASLRVIAPEDPQVVAALNRHVAAGGLLEPPFSFRTIQEGDEADFVQFD